MIAMGKAESPKRTRTLPPYVDGMGMDIGGRVSLGEN